MKYFVKRKKLLLFGSYILFILYLSLRTHIAKKTNYENIFNLYNKKINESLYDLKVNLQSQPRFKDIDIDLNNNQVDRKNWYNGTYSRWFNISELFKDWNKKSINVCNNQITFYDHNFMHAQNIAIDRTKCFSERQGGESIEAVILQSEDKEFYKFYPGFFVKKCSDYLKEYIFKNTNHLNEWLGNLVTNEEMNLLNQFKVIDSFTIAITRYEYANFYHTMTDWYNAFLLKEFFNKTALETNILLIDSHPVSNLDPVWSRLFNSTTQLSRLPLKTFYKDLVWGIIGYNSPLSISERYDNLPLLEEFRHFFLGAYGLNERINKRHNCNFFNILFIWRRDYVAHPRNPSGTVSRKIANEAELMRYLEEKLPITKFKIRGSQIDIFEMRDQLEQIISTDILVGMHGAGLSHALFLKKDAAIIELSPSYYFGEHFGFIAESRKLVYSSWINENITNELPNQLTIIPPAVLLTLIQNSIKRLCSLEQYKMLFSVF